MKLPIIIVGVLVVGLLLLAGCSQQKTVENLPTKEITVFKSASCGCCGIYSQYMEKEGFDVTVKQVATMDQVKKDFNIPANLQSCHTTQIGDYFLEGHIPLEAIEKLLTEKPDIAGIALPGMPSGSPGMPGSKNGEWKIIGVNHDGSTFEFMVL